MKKLSIRAISMILCLAMVAGYIVLPDAPVIQAEAETASPNLVENGTFETHLADGTVQANTDGWGFLTGDASVVADKDKPNNYAAKIEDKKSDGGKYIYYGVDVEPGSTYTFKIDYKGKYTSGSPAVILRQDNYNGAQLHIQRDLVGDNWKTYETTVEIPAGVKKVFIVLTSPSAAVGTVYIDNVTFQKGAHTSGDEGGNAGQGGTTPGANLVGNGTFETQSAGGTVANTDGWGFLTGEASVVADAGNPNNYVAKIEDKKSDGGRYIYYGVDVEPGSTYTFKIDYKGSYTSGSPAVILRQDQHNGAQLHIKRELVANNWRTYETTVEVPAGVKKVFIVLTSPSAAVGTIYIDNVTFQKGVHLSSDPSQGGAGATGGLIGNGTFEALYGGNTVANTDDWGNLAISQVWSVTEDPDKVGNFLLKLDDSGPGLGGSVFYKVRPEPGYYKVKLDYKTEDKPQLIVRADSHTSSGEDMAMAYLVSTEGEWSTLELTVQVPVGVSNVYVMLISGQAAKNLAFVDNISMEKIEKPGTDDDDQGGEGTEPDYDIVVPETNLIPNPFFELTLYSYCTPLDAATAPNGWTLETTDANVKLFKTNLVSAYKGEWSIQAVDNSATGSFKLSAKVENIQPGVEYSYLYARMGEGSPKIVVRYYDANGKMLKEFANARPGYDSWKQNSKTALAPAGASYAIVSLESAAADKCNIHLDDLSFYVSSDAKKVNLLPNASFEKYPATLQETHIDKKTVSTMQDWSIYRQVDLVPAETEMDREAVGNYMVKFTDDSPSLGCSLSSTGIDVEPGKSYTWSAMLRGEFTEGNPTLRFAFFEDENCTIPAYVEGAARKATSVGLSPDYWSQASYTLTAPENAVKLQVAVVSPGPGEGWMYVGNVSLMKDKVLKLPNLDFEDLDESGAVKSWDAYQNGTLSASKKTVFAGKISLQIKDNSEAVQQGVASKVVDLYGYQISGYQVDQMSFSLGARVKDSKNAKAQLILVYYDQALNEIKRESVTTNGSGKWQFLVLDTKRPEKATSAQILLVVGDKASATGTAYLDDVTFVGEYGQYIDEPYDWNIKYEDGNRLYFTKAELEEIRKFAKDDTLNAFGISGANAYRKLIWQADMYLEETSFTTYWTASPDNDKVTSYVVNMEHIQDISADPLLANVPGGRNWPYLESIAGSLRNRFNTVALAYAVTGDTKYSDQAISWAMDMCEWEYWCETKYSWGMGYLNSTLDTPRIVIGMASIYDMCYDQLTESQRALIRENILHKGIKPMYMDLTGPSRMQFHNKYMIRASGILIGTLAIINEDNKDELGKYLDRVYSFATAYLDERASTADNEGYSYASGSIEELVMGMESAARITGRESLLLHPYFTDILIDWVCDFLSPGNNTLPAFSDCLPGNLFKSTMLMLNKATGNGKAGYYLLQTGLDDDPFKVLLYCHHEPVITEPTENDYVVFAEKVGYGGLRTGWEDGDLMFYIIGNTSNVGHNNYDQLSFQITTDTLWPAADPGYSDLNEGFAEQEGHNTIIVDGEGQNMKGTGSLASIVDAQLYGQFSGSAPNAYMDPDEKGNLTIPKLTQFDRHAIMMNHGDRPYYIVIDEIASNDERVYDFNLNTGGWKAITVDGKPLDNEILQGNKVAIYGLSGYIFTEFVSKDKLNIEAKMYEDGGPVMQADNGSQKSQQFMTIITKAYGIKQDDRYSFLTLLDTPDLVKYKTSSNNSVITKAVNASGTPLYFFRGNKVGDWIELPFTAQESGTFELVLKIAKSYNYGIYKIFIDGEYVTTYDGYEARVYAHDLSLGKREIAAGEHVLRLELVGSNALTQDNLISVASITFVTEREMPDHPIYTQEVYDTDKVLGAKIFHTVNNSDIILHNRGTGKITAGGVTTTGEQAAIIGLMKDGYMEGFTVVAGTTLTFNGKTLMKSSSAATVSADYRGKALYTVTTAKKQTISLYAPYEIVGASVDGKEVDVKISGNVASLTVPAGTHTVKLKVKDAVEYAWGNEGGAGTTIYNENGEITYKYWKGIDGTEYLFEDGTLKIDAYYDVKTKLLVREELLEDGSWQITRYDMLGKVTKIEIEHTNGNLTTITYQADGSISTLITDKRGDYLEMTMDYPDGSKTVAKYEEDKTVTTKYGANGNVLNVTTMYNDGRRVEETYDENGKLISTITRLKGGVREETVYNADGTVVTSFYTGRKLTGMKTVNADGTAVLEEYLENGSIRVTKYDKDGNVTEVTVDGVLVVEETDDDISLGIIIAISAVALVGVAVLVIVLVKIKKRNAEPAEESAKEA